VAIVQMKMYPQAIAKIFNKEWDWDTDTIKATLHTATYVPSDAHDYHADLTNELTTANGYTAGGVTIGNRSISVVAANSWATQRANSTAYNVGEIVRPATGNGFVYRCSVAGTSGGSLPTYSTVIGRETADGTVVWTTVGTNVVRLLGDPATWAAPFSAGPFRVLVLWADTAGASAADPLIGYILYGSDQTGGDGSFTVTPNNGSWFDIPIP
jgi:hypothetical protein